MLLKNNFLVALFLTKRPFGFRAGNSLILDVTLWSVSSMTLVTDILS
jgi:hypothetical protein